MTRYLCTDATHVHDGTLHHVDLTAQVRLERDLIPRPTVHLAATEPVIAAVMMLDAFDLDERRTAIRRILTGSPDPARAPVLLVSERGLRTRRPGLHEVDELRRSEPAIERLLTMSGAPAARPGDAADFVILPEEGSDLPRELAPRPVTTSTEQQVVSIPQGLFDLWELADRLSIATPDEGALIEAIRRAPVLDTSLVPAGPPAPWRVVVTCPVAEGDPPVHHDVLFAGMGEPEAGVVQGVRPDGRDAILEHDAGHDLAAGRELGRAERRLSLLLLGAGILAIALLAFAWATGGLATAARETPGWLAFAGAVALAALAFGLVALFAPRTAEGNVNDTLAVGRFYASRIELLEIATAVAAGAFALALLLAVVPPVLATQAPRPAAAVSFVARGDAVIATVDVVVTGVADDDVVAVTMREFAAGSDEGTVIGLASATGDGEGTARIAQQLAVGTDAAFLAVDVAVDGIPVGPCDPTGADRPGCTVVSLPASLTDGRRPVVVSSLPAGATATATSSSTTTISPTVSPSPSVTTTSPTASPTVSITPAD